MGIEIPGEVQSWSLPDTSDAVFFEVVGLNSITIYMAPRLIDFDRANRFLFGGVVSLFPEKAAGVVSAVGYLAVIWLFLYILHRNKIYLKV